MLANAVAEGSRTVAVALGEGGGGGGMLARSSNLRHFFAVAYNQLFHL